jgi:hypothetical protein
MLESPLCRSKCRRGPQSVVEGPPAHDEIARIRVNRRFPLDTAGRILDEFNVERSGEAAGDFVLRLCEVDAIGFEPVRPKRGILSSHRSLPRSIRGTSATARDFPAYHMRESWFAGTAEPGN